MISDCLFVIRRMILGRELSDVFETRVILYEVWRRCYEDLWNRRASPMVIKAERYQRGRTSETHIGLFVILCRAVRFDRLFYPVWPAIEPLPGIVDAVHHSRGVAVSGTECLGRFE